jgi:hypothetical protein
MQGQNGFSMSGQIPQSIRPPPPVPPDFGATHGGEAEALRAEIQATEIQLLKSKLASLQRDMATAATGSGAAGAGQILATQALKVAEIAADEANKKKGVVQIGVVQEGVSMLSSTPHDIPVEEQGTDILSDHPFVGVVERVREDGKFYSDLRALQQEGGGKITSTSGFSLDAPREVKYVNHEEMRVLDHAAACTSVARAVRREGGRMPPPSEKPAPGGNSLRRPMVHIGIPAELKKKQFKETLALLLGPDGSRKIDWSHDKLAAYFDDVSNKLIKLESHVRWGATVVSQLIAPVGVDGRPMPVDGIDGAEAQLYIGHMMAMVRQMRMVMCHELLYHLDVGIRAESAARAPLPMVPVGPMIHTAQANLMAEKYAEISSKAKSKKGETKSGDKRRAEVQRVGAEKTARAGDQVSIRGAIAAGAPASGNGSGDHADTRPPATGGGSSGGGGAGKGQRPAEKK